VLSDTVTVIDLNSLAPHATLRVGRAPYGVAFSGDGARAFVTNQLGRSVSVIDLDTMRVAATWEAPEYPEGIATTADGQLVVVSWMDDLVQLLDGRSGQRRGQVSTGGNPRSFGRFIQP
jgi:YVTN family beta-propeller protein